MGCLDVEIFEKTICSHTRQWSRKGESPTAVGERLTGDGCAGNYKELLPDLAVILGNDIDEARSLEAIGQRKSCSRSGLISVVPRVRVMISCSLAGLKSSHQSDATSVETEWPLLWIASARFSSADKYMTTYSCCSAVRKIPFRPISCRGSYRRYLAASSRLPAD